MSDLLRSRILVLPTLAVLAVLAGCRRETRVAYEAPIEMEQLSASLSAPDNAYRLMSTEKTQGRFACGLAIVQIGRDGNADAAPRVVDMKPSDQAYWTEVFRGIPAVRELMFVSPVAVRFSGDDIDGICAAAERAGAALLIAHWRNTLGANSGEVLGALYDVKSRKPLATLHASNRFLNEDGVEESPRRETGDRREIDAGYQAARAFERFARACIKELVGNDGRPPTTQPHRWDGRARDRWWIPKRIKIDE